MPARSTTLGLDKCAVHQFLDDDEHRIATNTTSVYSSQVSRRKALKMNVGSYQQKAEGHTKR